MGGRGCARQWGIKGGEWDNCNSIINKIYFKKEEKKRSYESKFTCLGRFLGFLQALSKCGHLGIIKSIRTWTWILTLQSTTQSCNLGQSLGLSQPHFPQQYSGNNKNVSPNHLPVLLRYPSNLAIPIKALGKQEDLRHGSYKWIKLELLLGLGRWRQHSGFQLMVIAWVHMAL